jgi:nicotinamide-nucleotide amidase
MNDALEQLINDLGNLFREKAWTLCVAESVTVGRLQSLIGSLSGASDFFEGGITVYNLEQKVRHLGVDRDEANATNCVSPKVCRQMSRGACTLFQADVAIATTGYAEPDPNCGVEHPFAYVSIWQAETGSELVGLKVDGPPTDLWLDRQGQRRICQTCFAESALATLLDKLRPKTDLLSG